MKLRGTNREGARGRLKRQILGGIWENIYPNPCTLYILYYQVHLYNLGSALVLALGCYPQTIGYTLFCSLCNAKYVCFKNL